MEQKGSITIPVFDCIFHGSEAMESFTREFDPALYERLPNLYAICVADNSGKSKQIVAGFFVKTSYTHRDNEFSDEITAALASSEKLSKFAGPNTSLLPARLGVPDPTPLSEQEMLRVMMTQYTKYAVGGSA